MNKLSQTSAGIQCYTSKTGSTVYCGINHCACYSFQTSGVAGSIQFLSGSVEGWWTSHVVWHEICQEGSRLRDLATFRDILITWIYPGGWVQVISCTRSICVQEIGRRSTRKRKMRYRGRVFLVVLVLGAQDVKRYKIKICCLIQKVKSNSWITLQITAKCPVITQH